MAIWEFTLYQIEIEKKTLVKANAWKIALAEKKSLS